MFGWDHPNIPMKDTSKKHPIGGARKRKRSIVILAGLGWLACCISLQNLTVVGAGNNYSICVTLVHNRHMLFCYKIFIQVSRGPIGT
jgi:hypothetical protein